MDDSTNPEDEATQTWSDFDLSGEEGPVVGDDLTIDEGSQEEQRRTKRSGPVTRDDLLSDLRATIDKLEGDIPYRTDGEMSEVQLINECDGAFVVWDGHDQATLQLLQSIQKSGKPFFELRSSFALRVHNLEPTVVRNEAGEKVTPSGLVIP